MLYPIRLKFRLRTLLIFVGFLSAGMWWWVRPFTVVEFAGNGITHNYRARRSWNGKQYYVGAATFVYPNGNLAAKRNVDKTAVNGGAAVLYHDECEYWHDDGRKLASYEEWFAFMSFDFVYRQNGEKPSKTEKQWRAIVPKLKAAKQE